MASSCKFSYGSPNIMENAKFKEILDVLRQTGRGDSQIKMLRVRVTQEAPDAEADIIEGFTDELDGVAVPVVLDIVSSDAGDTSLLVTIIGLDADGLIVEEEIALDDTDSTTAVTTTNEFMRIIGATIESAPTGAITVHEHGGAVNTYCTIPAGDLQSISTKLWVPVGWNAVIAEVVPMFEIANAASPVLDNGINVGVNINGDVIARVVMPSSIGQPISAAMPLDEPIVGDGDVYMALQHGTLDTDANISNTLAITYLMWD